MSFVEIMIVIGVLAVIVAIVLPSVTGVIPASRGGTAEANLELLNQAVLKFNHGSAELTNAADAGDTSDEQEVFSALQTRDTTVIGSPFLGSEYAISASSSETTFRAQWNGRMFELIAPGASGTGLDLLQLQP